MYNTRILYMGKPEICEISGFIVFAQLRKIFLCYIDKTLNSCYNDIVLTPIKLKGDANMLFSENIKTMRQKLFLSQEAFAKKLTVSVSTVNRWEIGKSVPNLSTMKRIKDFCDMHNVDYVPIEESWLAAR